MKSMHVGFVLLLLFCVTGGVPPAAAADHAKIGVVKSTLSAPLYVAAAKGFFAEEGIDPEIVFFEAAQPIFVAVVSGDLDVGVSGVTGGFYQLASQGQLRIIAAHSREVPGFNGYGIFVSMPAYGAGLKSLKDIGGHSGGINTIGSSFHYSIALIAEKYGIDMKTIALKPLQQNTAITSALAGGTVDFAIVSNVYGLGPVAKGQAKVLGWVGDETPWQLGVAAVSPKTTDTRVDFVQRFLKAYRKGARFYHDAVTGPDEREHLNAAADEVIAITAKAIGQTPDEVKPAIAYADPDERLDVKDILHQIRWYKEQGMLKGDVDADTVIDKRYVIPLPAQ
ncbi:MAG TPA: ABC transporter substrate-binding protein [Stellaceae bacterium]|jgi:NitT/TauT family transport system substrate-binding protein|nr:ABC transporter substrate-binding protein [Stellaceae bacterium]